MGTLNNVIDYETFYKRKTEQLKKINNKRWFKFELVMEMKASLEKAKNNGTWKDL